MGALAQSLFETVKNEGQRVLVLPPLSGKAGYRKSDTQAVLFQLRHS